MFLGLPGHLGLAMAMALASLNGQDAGRDLLTRVADTDAGANLPERLLATKLRARHRSINGINGEEALERIRELNLANTYGFNREAMGATGNPRQPLLSPELQAGISERPGGKPVDASLHEDALLALWDSIASSIRLRPTQPPVPARDAATDQRKP